MGASGRPGRSWSLGSGWSTGIAVSDVGRSTHFVQVGNRTRNAPCAEISGAREALKGTVAAEHDIADFKRIHHLVAHRRESLGGIIAGGLKKEHGTRDFITAAPESIGPLGDLVDGGVSVRVGLAAAHHVECASLGVESSEGRGSAPTGFRTICRARPNSLYENDADIRRCERITVATDVFGSVKPHEPKHIEVAFGIGTSNGVRAHVGA